MSGAWLLGLALSLASGHVLVSWLASRPGATAPGRLLGLCLGAAAGLALSSLGFLALRIAGLGARAPVLALDLALLGLLLWLRRRGRLPGAPLARAAAAEGGASWPGAALHALLFAGGAAALAAVALAIRNHPHGWWDAWAIWNLKARFLATPGAEWLRVFSETVAWSHTDYPLLLPAAVARLWIYDGSLTPVAPAFLSAAFAALTVAALYTAVASFRGRAQGALAALCLLATPVFLEQSAHQIADLPLGFFLLCALATVGVAWRREPWSPGLWALVGLAAGSAAWTKNEGALMALALAAALWLAASRELGPGRATALLGRVLGALLPLAVGLAAFKGLLGGPSDLWAGQDWDAWRLRLADPARHRAILEGALSTAWSASGGWLLVELGLLAAVAGPARDAESRPLRRVAALGLLGVAAGYYAVYLLTPRDLAWQLDTSAHRLFAQLWPSALLLAFVALRPPAEWWIRAGRRAGGWPGSARSASDLPPR